MNLKSAITYLINPRSRVDKLTRVPAVVGSKLDDDSTWASPQLLSYGLSIVNLPLVVGMVVLIGLILIILFGPLWATHDPHITTQAFIPYYDADLRDLIKPPFPPSRDYPLGTDTWGNDLLSLILHGARVTLIAGAYITAVRVLSGTIIGSLAGWFANTIFDRLIMSLISAVTSVPTLLSAMILIFALDIQNGLWVFIVALAVLGWTEVAQYIRSEMLIIRGQPYIEGARAAGLNQVQIIVRHALPNVLAQILIMTFLEMGTVLILLAELGFLGVYIGGGTNFTIDILGTSGPQLLNEVPEWGALVSIGAPYLRSYPYMVLAPAAAFFIAVAGLNSLGEGLRRAVERSAVSTNFLLRKRMLLSVVLFSVVTALVLKYTGPSLSFGRVANAFDGSAAYHHVAALSEMDGRGAGQAGGDRAAAYIEDQFKEIGLQPGWKVGVNSNYAYRPTTQLVRPLIQPRLAHVANDGTVLRSFQHQIDFVYVIDGHGGSGETEAPLKFIHFKSGEFDPSVENYDPEMFAGTDVWGRIVLLIAGNAPEYFATEALRRGAQGVLWVQANNVLLRSQIQLADPEKRYLRNPTIPIFQLHEETADTMLEPAGVTLRQMIMDEQSADQAGPGWFSHDLDLRVAMSLRLEAPAEVEIPSVLGFYPGYDDHLADQLVVVIAPFDGLGSDPDGTSFAAANEGSSGVALMLEIARLWEKENVDPRRSILFLAWGGSLLDESGATAFLEDEDNFRKLSARVNTPPLKPAAVIQLGGVGAGVDNLWVDPDSEDGLLALWRETAAAIDIPLVYQENHMSANTGLVSEMIPTLSFHWADSRQSPAQDTIEQIDPLQLEKAGELLTLALIKIVRQVKY